MYVGGEKYKVGLAMSIWIYIYTSKTVKLQDFKNVFVVNGEFIKVLKKNTVMHWQHINFAREFQENKSL